MEDSTNIVLCIIGFMLIALWFGLYHNARVKCESSGGGLVSERIGKTYRLECIK